MVVVNYSTLLEAFPALAPYPGLAYVNDLPMTKPAIIPCPKVTTQHYTCLCRRYCTVGACLHPLPQQLQADLSKHQGRATSVVVDPTLSQ
jgi:hypothetical protein